MSLIGIEDPCECGNRDPGQYLLYETKRGQIIGKRCNLCHKEWLSEEYTQYNDDNQSDNFDPVGCSEASFEAGSKVHPNPDYKDSSEDSTDSPFSPTVNTGVLHLRNPFELDETTASQILGSRTKTDWNFEMLIPGNHIAWQRQLLGYWHHAIVVDINDYGMVVIHWTKTVRGQIKITKELLPVTQEDQDTLYRLDYPDEIEKANDITLVLARAHSRIGDKKYGLVEDNCESFATFCKTGSEKSHQIVWLKAKMKEFLNEFGVTAVKTLMKTGCKIASTMTQRTLQGVMKRVASMVSNAAEKAGEKIAETVIQEFAENLAKSAAKIQGKLTEEAIRQTWQSVASKTSNAVNKAASKITEEAVQEFLTQSAGKVTFAETVEKIKHASNWVGAGIVLFLEGLFVIKDVCKLHSKRKDGDKSRRIFIEEATRRSVEGISAASLTIAFSFAPEVIGAIIGTSVGPAGTFFGGIIGGAIGCALGKTIGTSAGSHLGRRVSQRFPDDIAVKSIKELNAGDHIVLNCGGRLHPRCHAIVVTHNSAQNHIKVIRNMYKKGVVEEWIEFTQPVYKVAYEDGECKNPEKVILYARLKKFEDYRYSLAKYNCKTFARECKTKST